MFEFDLFHHSFFSFSVLYFSLFYSFLYLVYEPFFFFPKSHFVSLILTKDNR